MIHRASRACFSWFGVMSKKCKLDVPSSGVKSNAVGGQTSRAAGGTAELTFLPPPVKSESDKKEYTTIRLANGLTALIISDTPNLIEVTSDLEEGATESSSEGSDNESTASGASSVSETSMASSKSDRPKRGAKKEEEKLAACSLTVGVGSFSDPDDIPGLAHFLEHMVFMGSSKFPEENAFDSYIKKTGGSDNASTECEYTTFYFESQDKYLYKAMDIFSQFFISPLMKRDAMTRERESIESEFMMTLPSDEDRKVQLLCSTAVPENPARKFMWGNLKTLKDNVDDDYLYKSLHQFRQRHYSAHRMTLAVQARLPTETLIEWVLDLFSDVPNNQEPPLKFNVPQKTFREELFLKQFYVQSVNDICEVEVNWALPPILDMYKYKPTDYAAWLLGHEGKGSLASYLRSKNLAFDVIAGHDEDGCSYNSIYTMFNVTIVLSEQGMKNLKDVLSALFSYVNLVKKSGSVARIFKEMQMVNEIAFKYATEASAVVNVESLSKNMQFYEPENYLNGSELLFDYRPDLIGQFIEYLLPSKANIMVSNRNPDYTCDKVEPWFETKYTMKDIPAEWVKEWESIEPYPEFHLPKPNMFITDDFSIYPPIRPEQKFPEKIKSTEVIDVWYKQDCKFKLPVACVRYHILSPTITGSLLESTTLDLYVMLLKQFLAEDCYPANSASLEHTLGTTCFGLSIGVHGYSQKLPLFLNSILNNIINFKAKLSEEKVSEMKKILSRSYYNSTLKAAVLATEMRLLTILDNFYTAGQKYSAIRDVTLDGIKDFSDNFYKNVQVQCLAQGNLTEETVLNMSEGFVQVLGCERNPTGRPMPEIQVLNIPRGDRCLRVKAFNKGDTNCITTSYFQVGPGSFQESSIIDLLMLLMEEPLYDILRTREQLGYDVSCRIRDSYGILGFTVTVNSQIDKYSVDHVEGRIKAFLENFVEGLFKMPKCEFERFAESLIKLKQCSDTHLKEEFERNWAEIKSQEYIFDRMEREVSHIRECKLEDLTSFCDSTVMPGGGNFKKLTVQVEGFPKKTDKLSTHSKEVLNSSPRRGKRSASLKFDENPSELPSEIVYELITNGGDRAPDYFVKDVNSFKSSTNLYPVTKINR